MIEVVDHCDFWGSFGGFGGNVQQVSNCAYGTRSLLRTCLLEKRCAFNGFEFLGVVWKDLCYFILYFDDEMGSPDDSISFRYIMLKVGFNFVSNCNYLSQKHVLGAF